MWRFAFVAVLIAAAVTAPATAAELNVLRVGILAPDRPAAAVARLDPFRAWLSDHIGLPVELVPVTNWRALNELEASGGVQYAIDSATSYVSVEAMCGCVVPLVAPLAFDGSRGFHSVLLVRADSPIGSLTDMKGARIAVSGVDSLAGRILPMKALAAAGVLPADLADQAIYDSPEGAVTALLDGTVDVAAAWSSLSGDAASGYSFGVLQNMVMDGRLSMANVRVVWQSDIIQFGPHTVRSDLPQDLRQKLADAVVALEGDAPEIVDLLDRNGLETGGFVPALPEDYAALSALTKDQGPTSSN